MESNTFANKIDGTGMKFGIVRARFNEGITQDLLDAARSTLLESGVKADDIFVAQVPGAFEIPVTAAKLITEHDLDGVITLGCIIQGATKHDEYLANAIYPAMSALAMETKVPVIAGVLTTNTKEQAIERSAHDKMNRGVEFAMAALETATTMRLI